MKIIDNMDQFARLKTNWDEVYSTDPDSTIFTSWGWIRCWIDTKSCDWLILAVLPGSGSSYVAFMPLGIYRTQKGAIGKLFLGASGHPGADSTGFVCTPEYAEEAIPAFGRYIQENMKWDIFEMRSVFDPRLDLFLMSFPQERYYLEEDKSNSCPFIILPDQWDQYLRDFLGTNTREKLKYYTRKIEKLDGFSITQTQEDDIDHHIDILLTLWQARHGQKSETILNRYRAIFRRCFENDCLWLSFFWEGSIPIIGKAAFLDRRKKSMSSFTVAFNDEYANYRPGSVMAGYAIRYAIENGFRIFDFGEGSEDYKFRFGAIERFHRNVSIAPQSIISRMKKRIPAKVKKTFKKETHIQYIKNILTGNK